jgi:hypothetical protein
MKAIHGVENSYLSRQHLHDVWQDRAFNASDDRMHIGTKETLATAFRRMGTIDEVAKSYVFLSLPKRDSYRVDHIISGGELGYCVARRRYGTKSEEGTYLDDLIFMKIVSLKKTGICGAATFA